MILRPQFLRLPAHVIGNHKVCRIQDILRRTVILLQLNHSRIRVNFLKIQDILDVGPTKFINRLVIIPHHAQIPVFFCQQADKFKLRRIGILILVDHYIFETLLVTVQYFCITFK